jgi:hypothetical protein
VVTCGLDGAVCYFDITNEFVEYWGLAAVCAEDIFILIIT